MPATLSDHGLRMLESFPPFLRDAYEMQGTIDAIARELDRIDAARDEVRANFYVDQAELLLSWWEAGLQLTVSPLKTIAQREATVLAFLRGLSSIGSGLAWEASVSDLIGSSWFYEEHVPGDADSPPPYTLRVHLPFTQTLEEPTGLTASPVSGGSLDVSTTYYYVVTAVNLYGETAASGEASASTSPVANRTIRLDWDDVAGASSYNVYRGTVAGEEERVAVGVADSTYDDADLGSSSGPPPTSNTTESYRTAEVRELLRRFSPAHIDFELAYTGGFIVGVSHLGEAEL